MEYTTRNTCRVCGSSDLTFLFSLGNQYVSDFPLPGQIPAGGKVPIDIEICGDCSLVQARHTAPQDFLYTRHYWYRSGVTSTMRTALRDIVHCANRLVRLNPGDAVLDIGSNDGTLLRCYPKHVTKVGVEPAVNLAEEGKQGVDHFIEEFWSQAAYHNRLDTLPKVITAIGMFYDLEDPNEFIADVSSVLHPDGLFIAQLMCLRNMLDTNDVGNFAHEHLEFYSLKSLDVLLGRHGMEIIDIEENSVNGRSYRLYIRHRGSALQPFIGSNSRVSQARMAEAGLHDPEYYDSFFSRLEYNRSRVFSFIESERRLGKRFWLYGASTKGNVILQYLGLDSSMIEGAAERSPEKYGRVTVETGIPIVSEADARTAKPDYFVVLPYAFLDEFIRREQEFFNLGGKFLVPIPSMEIFP